MARPILDGTIRQSEASRKEDICQRRDLIQREGSYSVVSMRERTEDMSIDTEIARGNAFVYTQPILLHYVVKKPRYIFWSTLTFRSR